MFLLIDNYDSFTYNLLHFMGELGAEVEVRRNDAISAADAVNMGAEGIVISPGPCDPDRAGICLDVVALAAERRLPLLGVCLGHQCIGQHFNGVVERAPKPMHGKISTITHDGRGVFAGLEQGFSAGRYHSLVATAVPDEFEVTATTEDGGEELVMGVRHREHPIECVQFHPESVLTAVGHDLIENFLALAAPPVA